MKKQRDFCPYGWCYLGIQIPCAYPEEDECGFRPVIYEELENSRSTNYRLAICEYKAKEIGIKKAIQEALELALRRIPDIGGDGNDYSG